MENAAEQNWIRLDNAAKIYPAARSRNWTALFRLSAELTEPVDPNILAKAQERTLRRFPGFALRLRSGLFWHYLERVTGAPPIQPDVANPCVRMDTRENGGFMFRVRYHEKRVAVEIFHVLTDGTGGLTFLKTLIAEYLTLKYGEIIPRDDSVLDVRREPDDSELEDSFIRFSRGVPAPRKEASAYRLRGTPERPHFMNIITGMMPAGEVKKLAETYGGTVTELLAALLILSVRQIQRKEIKKSLCEAPVKVCIPVNLRKFYPTKNLRNFSSFVNPGIQPKYGEYTLSETIQSVKHFLGLEATEKMLNARMSANVLSEMNPLVRFMPLFIKTQALRLAHKHNGDRTSSITLSNLGAQTLPEPMAGRVARMDFMLGSLKYNPVTCACVTLGGTLVVNFTRNIVEPTLERHFFTQLVKLGIPVEIESNRED